MNPFSYFYINVHKSVITSCTLLMLLQRTWGKMFAQPIYYQFGEMIYLISFQFSFL